MVVVPEYDQIHGTDGVAQQFFTLTLGRLAANNIGNRIFNAFLAISSLGNIIVMTYTAARVKQEIAKEGILPFPKFFAQNKDMSLGRLLGWFQTKGWFGSLTRMRWFSPEEHSEQTPVGAFVLHFFSCLVLIFATWGLHPDSAYNLLTSLSAYVINGFFGSFLGLGILILRFRGPPASAESKDHQALPEAPRTWRSMTGNRINPIVSVVCATIYMAGNVWPIVTYWIKPTDALEALATIKWWLVPTISWTVIALGVAWFLGFMGVAHRVERKHQKVFIVEKKPEFESADSHNDNGGLVLVHETVYLSWVGRETLRDAQSDDMVDGLPMTKQPDPVEVTVAERDFGSNVQQNTYPSPPMQFHQGPNQFYQEQSQSHHGHNQPYQEQSQFHQGYNQPYQGQHQQRGYSGGYGY